MNAQDYSRKIEEVYSSLEKSRPLRSSNTAVGNIKRVLIASAAVSIGSAFMVGLVMPPTPTSNLLAGGFAILGGAASLLLGNLRQTARFTLPLIGKSTSIDLLEAEMISVFANRYPRLAEIAGKWMADNPDDKLNMNNFHRLDRAYKKILHLEQKLTITQKNKP